MQSDLPSSDTRVGGVAADESILNDFAFAADSAGSYRRAGFRRSLSLPSTLFRYRVVKRILDIVLIILSIPVLVPALFLVGLVVKLTSRGPAFFSHRRICRDGAFFSMWKFRTMCVDSSDVLEQYLAKHPKARSEWARSHKLRHDPRITPVGLFLRRFSLDELPQAWNVLRGQMSLVGPRPIVAAEVEKYADSFEYYCRVKPGVTGLWQVSGRSELTYDERVALDRRYVTRWSLFADLKILLRTFKSVVNRDGAY
jgi:Undecaprenyl-phosphate galactose phosphotransferase WbaP